MKFAKQLIDVLISYNITLEDKRFNVSQEDDDHKFH